MKPKYASEFEMRERARKLAATEPPPTPRAGATAGRIASPGGTQAGQRASGECRMIGRPKKTPAPVRDPNGGMVRPVAVQRGRYGAPGAAELPHGGRRHQLHPPGVGGCQRALPAGQGQDLRRLRGNAWRRVQAPQGFEATDDGLPPGSADAFVGVLRK